MKPENLMVGDWLQHASGKYFQVTRIDMWGDGSVHFACGNPHLWEYNNEFSPISLTTEIVKKNGFQQISINEYVSGKVTISIFVEGFLITIKSGNARARITIKYVHELQHALLLCNIDKEIKL